MQNIVPFDKRDGYIWFNGKLVDWQDAKIHVLTHGLHYGSCVFEGVRVYNGKIFENTWHNKRFIESGNILGFNIPYSIQELDSAVEEVVKKQGVKDGYVRPFAWRGSEQVQISARFTSINVAIACWEVAGYYGQDSKLDGIRVKMARYRRPHPNSAPYASKAAGLYMICTVSKHEAEDQGFNDALMLDYRGFLAETTGANLFLVIGDELHTPIADCFLNGITRQIVIKLAKENGIKVVERHIRAPELLDASDCFVTGTAAEITRIKEVDLTELGDDAGGAEVLPQKKKINFVVNNVTTKLRELYKSLVKSY